MLELPEECPGYDYGLKVSSKEGEMEKPQTSLLPGRLKISSNTGCYAQVQSVRMPTQQLYWENPLSQVFLARSRLKRVCLNPPDPRTALAKLNTLLMLSIW